MAPSSTQSNLPVALVVHGAYHTPKSLEPFLFSLKTAGFDVHAPWLPTCNDAHPPNSSFSDDISTVRSTLSKLVEQKGKRVMVIMHSYGGMPGTEAVDPSLLYSTRKSQGQAGGVVHLFYMCAFVLSPPYTLASALAHGENGTQMVDISDDGTAVAKSAEVAARYFYSDIEDDKLVKRTCATLVPWNFAPVLQAELKGEAWKQVGSTYLRTTKDAVVWPRQQDMMLEHAQKKGGKIEVVTWDCGHSPFLNRRDELVGLIRKTAESVQL